MRPLRTNLVVLACVASLHAWAADATDGEFRKGLTAFNRGDYSTALRVWRPLAERGDPRSESGIGFMYHRGMGVDVDDREAVSWLSRAAEHGQAEGQLMLGVLFYDGRGVPKSYVQAYAWCELAETNGNADAMLCRDAALESMSNSDREEAFRLVGELRERYGPHR
jgi:TPR repeat protein